MYARIKIMFAYLEQMCPLRMRHDGLSIFFKFYDIFIIMNLILAPEITALNFCAESVTLKVMLIGLFRSHVTFFFSFCVVTVRS